ncbi:S1 family peptidase, partial [Deinococcus cellulosilyticus]
MLSPIANSNIIHRVAKVIWGSGTGTGVFVDYRDTMYFITAYHVVKGIKDGHLLTIMPHTGKEVTVTVRIVCMSPDADYIVFTFDEFAGQLPLANLPVHLDLEFTLTQEALYVGYPKGLVMTGGDGQGIPKTLPLFKQGIISALDSSDPADQFILLDSAGNAGFSGGPIFVVEKQLAAGGGITHLIGIVLANLRDDETGNYLFAYARSIKQITD